MLPPRRPDTPQAAAAAAASGGGRGGGDDEASQDDPHPSNRQQQQRQEEQEQEREQQEEDLVLEAADMTPREPTGLAPSGSCLIISQGHALRVDVSVRSSLGSPPSRRVDLSVGHSLSSSSREFDMGRICTSVAQVPVRSVSSLRSLFDLASPAACNPDYGHGREIGGKSSVLALQVPASSLSPPLTASAVADSVQIGSSGAFFSSFGSSEPRLIATVPSARNNIGCIQCQPVQGADASCPLRSEERGGVSCINMEGTARVAENSRSRGQEGIMHRLSEVLQGRGDEDLALQRDGTQSMMLQWLQALDLHVVGACRADERLRPMLRWNVSCCSADSRILAQLNEHFKARELGLLARCLCAPLVTVRMGKVHRQGRLLCPTAARGYLSLTMLPSSELRLSFVGDNGAVERIAAVRPGSEYSPVAVEMLHADTSGRTLVVKSPCGKEVYFWQSERSKASGDELLLKMKDILKRRPTLAQLTGIHESRLESFVSHLRTSLLATSTSNCFQQSSTSSSSIGSTRTTDNNAAVPSTSAGTSPAVPARQTQQLCLNRVSPSYLSNGQPIMHAKAHSGNQGSLSPRTSVFKDGTVKSVATVRSMISSRDKHRRHVDTFSPAIFSTVPSDDRSNCSENSADLINELNASWSTHVSRSLRNEDRKEKPPNARLYTSMQSVSCTIGQRDFTCGGDVPLSERLPVGSSGGSVSQNLFPSLIGRPFPSSSIFHPPASSHLPISTSTILAPYYCPCPLRSAGLPYTFTPPFLPSSSESSVSPPSPSLFSLRSMPAFLSQTSISLDRVTLSPIPLPVSSLVNLPTPLQTSSHPLLFSDPIVHIPVINLQSANQSYLVTAPPAISSTVISPALPSFLSSVLPCTEAQIEKQELSALNFLRSLDVSSSWDKLEDQQKGFKDKHTFLSDNKREALLETFPEAIFAAAAVKQEGENSCFEQLESSRSLSESVRSSVNFRSGPRTVGSSCDKLVHYDALPQHSGPLLGMVPALLTSGSLSCVLNFCQDRGTKGSAWVSGSRGLYGGSCEPGIPAPLFTSSSSSITACSKDRNTCGPHQRNAISSENIEVQLPFNIKESVEGGEVTEKENDDSFEP